MSYCHIKYQLRASHSKKWCGSQTFGATFSQEDAFEYSTDIPFVSSENWHALRSERDTAYTYEETFSETLNYCLILHQVNKSHIYCLMSSTLEMLHCSDVKILKSEIMYLCYSARLLSSLTVLQA